MPDVSLGRFSRSFEKLFNSKGGQLLVDVEPSISIATLLNFQPVEERYLQSWNRFGSAMNGSAVPGQFSSAQIRNPVGSNVIAVVESLIVLQLSATTRSLIDLAVNPGQVDLASVGSNTRLDGRTNGQGATCSVTSGSVTTIGGVISVTAIAGLPFQWIQFEDQELTISPGDFSRVSNVTANEAITVGFIWRERALESSELI